METLESIDYSIVRNNLFEEKFLPRSLLVAATIQPGIMPLISPRTVIAEFDITRVIIRTMSHFNYTAIVNCRGVVGRVGNVSSSRSEISIKRDSKTRSWRGSSHHCRRNDFDEFIPSNIITRAGMEMEKIRNVASM